MFSLRELFANHFLWVKNQNYDNEKHQGRVQGEWTELEKGKRGNVSTCNEVFKKKKKEKLMK